MATTAAALTSGLLPQDLGKVSVVGLQTRKLRAALSALGIAIGVAAIVAVLGLSASSQAGLLAEINQLGTNLLTATNGQNFFGQTAELPMVAPAMIRQIPGVTSVQDTGTTTASVFKSPYIPSTDTNALSVDATSLQLPATIGTAVRAGPFLNAATAELPDCVLGAAAAQRPRHRDGVPERARLAGGDVVLRRRDLEAGDPCVRGRLLGPRRLSGR